MVSASRATTLLGAILLGIALGTPHALASDVMSETRIESPAPTVPPAPPASTESLEAEPLNAPSPAGAAERPASAETPTRASGVPSTREGLATRYQLGTGDVISIRVFDEPDLSFDRIRLSDAATVPFPLLGEIQARGRTPVELESRIRDKLAEGYLVEPRVTVNVVQYRQFYVSGEVASPGGFAFQPGITVRKALALAGDTTDRASERKMFIIRDTKPEEAREAAADERRRPVTMNDLLLPGDTLLIEASFF